MKKKFMLAGACLTMASAMVLGACSAGGNNGGTSGTALTDTNDVYGIGAVSTVKLLGTSINAQSVQTLSAVRKVVSTEESDSTEDEVKEQVDRFNEYFTALDSFLGDDVVSTVCEENSDEEYPYDTKLTISGKELDGESVTYVMYYSESFLNEWVNDYKTESVYVLEGIFVLDGVDYYLEGRRSVEQGQIHNDTEQELKIRAYADKENTTDYIEMKQETSQEEDGEETEYVYSIYVAGRLVEQTAVEFETERRGERETTEYELEFRSGKTKGKYEIVRKVENDVAQITVKYDIDGCKGEFRIRELTGEDGEKQYEYTFADKSRKILK